MRTTATNRKVRLLLRGIRDKTLIPRPEFQRRLVWTTKDKRRFLDTVLKGYPFPEIYIAAGSVDLETGEGTELLVDGQQRITTLFQYFTASPELNLGREITPYAQLTEQEKNAFLEYEVVVRDLGKMAIEEIKAVFERINATKYSLNDMEIHNARFSGEFKTFAEKISQHTFFERHRIFSANEIRRMLDVSFAVTFIITIMSTYFNRDDEFENYLSMYNDEFELKDDLEREIQRVIDFIESCQLGDGSRAWKKSDLLTLLVETHRALIKNRLELNPEHVGTGLRQFYQEVNNPEIINQDDKQRLKDVTEYAKDASQATNDRGTRIRRGQIIQRIIAPINERMLNPASAS